MRVRHLIADREQVQAIQHGLQRAVTVDPSDEMKTGEYLRIVSDDAEVHDRIEAVVMTTWRSDPRKPGDAQISIVSISPLSYHERFNYLHSVMPREEAPE